MKRFLFVLVGVSLSGCSEARSASNKSSGSNWLTCETLSDCAAASEAATCSDGYCEDRAGERIVREQRDAQVLDDGGPQSDAPLGQECVWGLEQLLLEVGVTLVDPVDCGTFNSSEVERIDAALPCFRSAPPTRGARFTVNYCTDCSIPSTYVSTPEGDIFHVRMEEDLFGDDVREANVEQCGGLIDLDYEGIRCDNAVELYACRDALR